MVNFNGRFYGDDAPLLRPDNRGFCYGDVLFETIRVQEGRLLFWEDHYLRLMASMRILRMEIPMEFTMEFLEGHIRESVAKDNLDGKGAEIQLTVFRNSGENPSFHTNGVSFLIRCKEIPSQGYDLDTTAYEVELFKDFWVNKDLLSRLRTNHRSLNVVGRIFAQENGYQDCLLLNGEKSVVGALDANIFVVFGNTVKTPPLSDGCINGIVRKKLMDLMGKMDGLEIREESIAPFGLQKADELFLTNIAQGIRPITKYRKKEYGHTIASRVLQELNQQLLA
ncbi:MAG: aminotransferase class IV [Flavobacteriaceae bacterium]